MITNQAASPDKPRAMTQLRNEVLPPSNIQITPDGQRWASPDGKTGIVGSIGEKKIYIPQQAVDRAGGLVNGARGNAEGIIQRLEQSNPGKSNEAAAQAANAIASRVETLAKQAQPDQTEVKKGELNYIYERQIRLAELAQERATQDQIKLEANDLQTTIAGLQANGGDAILYHLGRLQLLAEQSRTALTAELNPDGTFKKGGKGLNAWVELQKMEASRNVMERKLLIPQIIRRAQGAKHEHVVRQKNENAKTLLVENLPNPAKFEAMVADYQRKGLITADEAKQNLEAMAQRFGNFTLGHEKGGILDKSTAQKSLDADIGSRDRWLGTGNNDSLQALLTDFSTNQGLSNAELQKLTPVERQIFSNMATSRLELARLAAFERFDPKHALEITEAKKLYLQSLKNGKVEEQWDALKKQKGWK